MGISPSAALPYSPYTDTLPRPHIVRLPERPLESPLSYALPILVPPKNCHIPLPMRPCPILIRLRAFPYKAAFRISIYRYSRYPYNGVAVSAHRKTPLCEGALCCCVWGCAVLGGYYLELYVGALSSSLCPARKRTTLVR